MIAGSTKSTNVVGTGRVTLGLGTIVTDGYGEKNADGFVALLEGAAALGITNVDTAAIYGFGESEELLGRWMQELGLDFEICTKIGVVPADGQAGTQQLPFVPSGDPESLKRQIEATLKRLRRDKVECLLLHNVDPLVPVQVSMEALAAFREEGIADRIGFSNIDHVNALSLMKTGIVDVVQYPWSLLDGRRRDTLNAAGDFGVQRMVYGLLGFGILAGSVEMDTKFADDDWRGVARSGRNPGTNGAPLFLGNTFDRAVNNAKELASATKATGLSPGAATVAASLCVAPAEKLIVGCRNIAELQELTSHLDVELSPQVIEQAKTLNVLN